MYNSYSRVMSKHTVICGAYTRFCQPYRNCPARCPQLPCVANPTKTVVQGVHNYRVCCAACNKHTHSTSLLYSSVIQRSWTLAHTLHFIALFLCCASRHWRTHSTSNTGPGHWRTHSTSLLYSSDECRSWTLEHTLHFIALFLWWMQVLDMAACLRNTNLHARFVSNFRWVWGGSGRVVWLWL